MNANTTPYGLTISVTNLMYKFAAYASVLIAGDYLLPGLYPSLWPVAATVIIMTAIGTVADVTIVPRLGNVASLLLGMIGVTAIIWGTALFWPNTNVTLGRALGLAVFIAPIEYALHKYVLNNLYPTRTDA